MNNLNRYDQAIISYEEYLKVSPQLGVYRNPSMEAEVCRKLAYAYSTQGKYKQALSYLGKALRTDSTNSNNGLEVVEDYRQLGLVHAYSGNFKEALKNLEKSLRLNRGMEKSAKSIKQSSIAETYLALAQVNLTLGNYDETNRYAQLAQLIYEKLPNEFTGVLESQLIIGIVARDKGNLKKALENIEASRKIAFTHHLNTTRHLQALGEVYLIQGDLESSIRYKTQAVEEAEKANIKPQTIIAYMRLGDAYHQLGDADKANQNYKRALEIQAKMNEGDTVSFVPSATMKLGNLHQAYDYYVRSGSSLGAGLVCLRLGEMQLENSQHDSAYVLFSQAKVFFEKVENKEGQAKANLELAKVLTLKKAYQEAQQLLAEADKQTIQPDLKWQIYYRDAIIKENLGDKEQARNLLEKAIEVIAGMRANLSIDELKTLFANTKVDVYDKLILLLLKNKDNWSDLTSQHAITKAFQLNEQARSRTFLDMLGNRRVEPKKNADTVLLNQEQLLRLKMQQLVQEINRAAELSESRAELINELDQTQNQHRDVLQKIKLNSAEYATMISVEPPSLSEVQSKIDDQTALLEYWVSDEALVVWMVTRTKITVEIVLVSRKNLLKQISAARKTISLQLESSKQHLSTLYGYLVKSLEEKLTPYKYLVIVPHRSLHFLPFQALTNSSGKFFIEQYVLSYAPSSSIYYYCKNRHPATGNKFFGLALGDVSIGEYPGLPGTELEVNQLSRLYESSALQTKTEFQETTFKQQVSNYNYIHIATHGIFNKQQPLYSYLLMGNSNQDDGRLTVDEIFGLNVKSKLVTLSACETALGNLDESDELVGLSRAFIYAGTPDIVVSLWQVDDAITAWLMMRFNQYLSSGYNGAEAIAYAQRDFIQRNFTNTKTRGLKEVVLERPIKTSIISTNTALSAHNPFFWAPFILIGNGTVN